MGLYFEPKSRPNPLVGPEAVVWDIVLINERDVGMSHIPLVGGFG